MSWPIKIDDTVQPVFASPFCKNKLALIAKHHYVEHYVCIVLCFFWNAQNLKNSADNCCYICCEVSFVSQKWNMTAVITIAYNLYYGRKIRDGHHTYVAILTQHL